MSLFTQLTERLATAERRRKASPPQTLRYSGLFFTIPIFFGLWLLCIKFGRHFLDRAGAITIWLIFVVVVTTIVFVSGTWQRRVPIKFQIGSAVVAWLVLIWMFFYFQFWNL